MYCEFKGRERPYPDIISHDVAPFELGEGEEADLGPTMECATGQQLSTAEVCGVVALACFQRRNEILASETADAS
jgi:hypothetical protein